MALGILGDYVAVCSGDMHAGVLLHRMAFLYAQATLVIDGQRWYVQSRDELLSATGMTENRYRIVRNTLIELGFVEFTYTASMKKSTSLRTTAFRVDEKVNVAVAELVSARQKHATGSLPGAATGSLDGHTTGHVPGATTIYSSDSISHGSSHSRSEADGKATAKSLEEAFRVAYKNVDPNYFHVSWGVRKKAVAKSFINTTKDHDPLKVVQRCISSWPMFRAFLRDSTSQKIPDKPDIFLLVSHAGLAVEFSKKVLVSAKPKKSKLVSLGATE